MTTVFALLVLTAAARTPFTECPKWADVGGSDPALVALVRTELERGGLLPASVKDAAQCPGVQAIVSRVSGGVQVELQDKGRAEEERVVASVESAAIMIESWVLAEGATIEARDDDAPKLLPRVALAIRPEFAFADDASGFGGLALGASWIFGSFAANVITRAAVAVERDVMILHVAVAFGPSLELDFEEFSLSIGAGAGVRQGRWRVAVPERCPPDQPCTPGSLIPGEPPPNKRSDFSTEGWLILRSGRSLGLEYECAATLQYMPRGQKYRGDVRPLNQVMAHLGLGLWWGL